MGILQRRFPMAAILTALSPACQSASPQKESFESTTDSAVDGGLDTADIAGPDSDWPDGTVVLDHVRVVDATGVREDVAVVVASDTIFGIVAGGGPFADDADVRDLTGSTVMPGLIDAHVHLFLDGMVLPEGDHLEANLRAYLAWGVVGVGDFGAPTAIFDLRDRIARGSVQGPRVWATGPFITVPGAHPCESINDPDQCRFVETSGDGAGFVEIDLAASDGVKLALGDAAFTPWPTPRIDLADVAEVAAAAHDAGKLLVAHTNTSVDAADALAQGVDVLAHPPFDAPAASAWSTPMTSTVGAFGGTGWLLDGDLLADDLSFTPEVVQEEWTAIWENPDAWLSDDWRTESARWTEAAESNVAAAIEGGQTVLAGSDAGYVFVPHGLGLHRELERLVELGMSPLEAIEAATSRPAALFGWTDLGFISPGYRATFLVVQGDPSTDIRATRIIDEVWIDGAAIDRSADLVQIPGDGSTCLTEGDCAEGLGCDRFAHTCEPECAEAYDYTLCDEDSACIPADGDDAAPICMTFHSCDLLAQDCAPAWYGENCVPADLDTNYCWPAGPRLPGEACSWINPDQFCEQGSYCSPVDRTCYAFCDPSDASDCASCSRVRVDGNDWFGLCLDF